MKFSTAILALAAFLSAVNAVPLDRRDDIIPGLLKARDTAQVRGRGRVAITRDEHDDHIDFHHLSHDEEKELNSSGDYYPELFSEEAYDHKNEHKGEHKHDEHKEEKHDDHEDDHEEKH